MKKKSYYKSIEDIGMSNTFKILANNLFGVTMTRCERFNNFKIVTTEEQVDKRVKKPNFDSRNIVNKSFSILEMEKLSVVYSYPILIGSIILQNSKVHMYNYLYKIYPKLFKGYKLLYMDTDSIYTRLNMSHEEYIVILENNKDLFGKHIGQMEVEYLNNPIKEAVFLSSKSYSYICKNDIEDNKHKMKNSVLHTKVISYSYSKQYIDLNLFKQTLLNDDKPQKISFNTIQIKNQKISTKKTTKYNIQFLNDKRYIKDINSNVPHTLYIE